MLRIDAASGVFLKIYVQHNNVCVNGGDNEVVTLHPTTNRDFTQQVFVPPPFSSLCFLRHSTV